MPLGLAFAIFLDCFFPVYKILLSIIKKLEAFGENIQNIIPNILQRCLNLIREAYNVEELIELWNLFLDADCLAKSIGLGGHFSLWAAVFIALSVCARVLTISKEVWEMISCPTSYLATRNQDGSWPRYFSIWLVYLGNFLVDPSCVVFSNYDPTHNLFDQSLFCKHDLHSVYHCLVIWPKWWSVNIVETTMLLVVHLNHILWFSEPS